MGPDVEAQFVGDHKDRLAETGTECVDHDARASPFRGLAEQHPIAHDIGSAIGANV